MAVTIVRTTTSSQLGSLLTQASASTTYLTQVSASTTYAPIIPTTNTTFRNVLINGDFSIDQRNSGASQTITSTNAYTADRWYANAAGANVTGARIAGAVPTQYYYRFTGATSNTQVTLAQRIEAANSYHMAGQTVTISAKIASSSLTSITWSLGYATATDNFAGITGGPTGTFTINSTLTTYSATFTVPAGATTGLRFLLQTATGLVASQTLTIADVQLELGSIATPFEHRFIGAELALCQRYYQTSFSGSGVAPGHNASGNGIIYHPGVSGGISGNIYTNIRFPFMRTSPAVNIWNGNNASATPATAALTGGLNTSASGMRIYTAGGVGYDSTNIGIDYIRNDSISLYAQASTGGAASGILAFGYSLNAEL